MRVIYVFSPQSLIVFFIKRVESKKHIVKNFVMIYMIEVTKLVEYHGIYKLDRRIYQIKVQSDDLLIYGAFAPSGHSLFDFKRIAVGK